MRYFIFILLLILVCPIYLLSQDSIDVFIADQMKQQRIVGLSLGVVKNGKVFKAAGYGKANVELDVPVSEQTVFKIASVSKQFIAIAVLKLIREGRLSLETPVKKFIKNTPDTWRTMTVRHLLNHTSGLPEDPPGYDGMKSLPDSVYIARSFKNKLDFTPGGKFQYSNLGYYVLADIIRIVSGQPYAEYLKTNVFDVAGLKATRTVSVQSIVANRAGGYIEDSAGKLQNAPNHIAVRPSGALMSNISDLLVWEKVLQEDRLFNYGQSNLNFNEASKTAFSMDDQPIYYRFGWMINNVGDNYVAHHGGSLPGFKCVYLRYLEEKTAIIVLTNSDQTDAYSIAFGVMDLLKKAD